MESGRDVLNPKIYISDQYLVENRIVSDTTKFVPINLNKILTIPVKVEDISQKSVGNCYMLAALASIVERSPFYLNNIMKIRNINNKQHIEVTLHDSNDVNKKITYVLDPTIVMDPKKMNRHSHNAIYLIEKAYAIHRIINERKSFKEEELDILNALIDNQFNIENTFQIFSEKIDKVSIKHIKDKYDKNYQTYTSALRGGYSFSVYASMLGVSSANIKMPPDFNAEYLLGNFLSNIQLFKLGNLDTEFSESTEKLVLEKMFDSIDSPEAKFFINIISPMTYINASEFFEKTKTSTSSLPQQNIHLLLKEFFFKVIEDALNLSQEERTDSIFEVAQSAKVRISDFITKEVPYKRGLGIYTLSQLDTFNLIQNQLKEGQLLALSTKQTIGRNQTANNLYSGESLSKGLVGGHAYHVVNCYERNGIKFVLIRNPWGEYERDYKLKKKEINKKEVVVLSAFERKRSSLFSFDYLFKSKDPINNAAIPMNDAQFNSSYNEHGYFEIELGDLTKRFCRISITTEPGGVDLTYSPNLIPGTRNPKNN